MKYLLQSAIDTEVFESVDEYTFKNRHHAVLDGGKARYSGLAVSFDGEHIMVEGGILSVKEWAILSRYLCLNPIQGAKLGGWVREPESVYFVLPRGRKEVLHQMNGDNFVRIRKAA